MVARRQLKLYDPIFKGPIEGYVMNFLRANTWRVDRTMEHDDMMQEARVVFLYLSQKYPTIDTPQHFMALYKTAWFNRFTDLTHKDTRSRHVVSYSQNEDEGDDYIGAIAGDLSHDGALLTAIRQAPSEVQSVVSLFLNAPVELLDLASAAWRSRGHNRDHGNAMLCKMLGVKTDTDLVGMVETYFSDV